MKNQALVKAGIYSEEQIERLRGEVSRLAPLLSGCTVVVVGSFARKEASHQSDLDYFVICEHDCHGDSLPKLRELIGSLGIRPPSSDGAFGKFVTVNDFVESIGGAGESNEVLTRRMLFLLESTWIYGGDLYKSVFDEVVKKYIKDGTTEHQLARFLLNDLIRYYRTICVDFEYKTVDGGKSWGDRNLKLMYSRKLMYFSGIIAVAQTAQSSVEVKRGELRRLLTLTPTDRILDVCGAAAGDVLQRYDQFLTWMESAEVRRILRETTQDRASHTPEFRAFKNSGHHFSWALEVLFNQVYAQSHPIRQAIFM